MKVKDIVRFNRERCFNGAIQTEWFYDKNKVNDVAESYVFHGPKYYGVSEVDVEAGSHRLIDTASFALNVANKLYERQPANSFMMTIAGYGAGKSHLAVSLAALFSGNTDSADVVNENICRADLEIGAKIKELHNRKNLVLVLNGMNNFNLDAEMLRCARLVLNQNGLTEDVLKSLTKSYDIARHFLNRNFEISQTEFEQEAKKYSITQTGSRLKQYLNDNIENNSLVLTVVNNVYKEVTGDYIRWERGLSAGDILTALYNNLCGEDKQFNKILLLFDEFGRYIEYAAANPAIAGEAALQQIFEAVQDAKGGIIFNGFVQSELDAYLARIEKTSNIMRYVGRYKNSEKLFLSSNFETILANLIYKSNPERYKQLLTNEMNRSERYYDFVQKNILRWNRSAVKKNVWSSTSMYSSVIVEGCYPLHPITVWLLSNMDKWMQQRSAIAFVAEMVDQIANAEITNDGLPQIRPIDIIDSSIYSEMLNSEEKGLVQSQFCMLYRDILLKVGNKLTLEELNILKAILVINIGRFALSDKEDAITAIRYCCGLSFEKIEQSLDALENMHGVIVYDDHSNTFDFMAEANGYNEFKRTYNRYKMMTSVLGLDEFESALSGYVSGIDSYMDTQFAQEKHIASLEWRFKERFLRSESIHSKTIDKIVQNLEADCTGEGYRGELIYLYCDGDSEAEINRISLLCKEMDLDNYPIIIILLDDTDKDILKSLEYLKVLQSFSKNDNEKFRKHIEDYAKKQDKLIKKKFRELVQKRLMITSEGIVQYQGRINHLCSNKFNTVFTECPSFMFDGFEKKTTATAKRYLANLCIKLFDRTLMNVQSYSALSTDEKNRVKASLAVGVPTSWQVFDNSCNLIQPLDLKVLPLVRYVENELEEDKTVVVSELISLFSRKPYGMNINSIALFVFYFIAYQERKIVCFYGNERLQAGHVSDKIFKSSKIQISEFGKIRINVNKSYGKDYVKQACDKTMKCVYVEQCQMCKDELEEAVLQEGVSVENQLPVASAETRIEEGIALRDKIYDDLHKGQAIINDNRVKFELPKFVKVFAYFVNSEGIIKDGLPFIYSDNYKSEMSVMKESANSLLDKKFMNAIEEYGRRINVKQLSQYRQSCKSIVNTLRKNGYEQYATALENKAIEHEKAIEAVEKYKQAIIELDKAVQLHADVNTYSFVKCENTLIELNNMKKYFNSLTDMPEQIRREHLSKIKRITDALSQRENDIKAKYDALMKRFNSATTMHQWIEIESEAAKVRLIGLAEKDNMAIKQCQDQITALKVKVSRLPDTIEELLAEKGKITEIEDSQQKNILLNEVCSRLEKFYKNQGRWIKDFIVPIELSVDDMSAYDCQRWLKKTERVPLYLDSATILRHQEAIRHVEKRLHDSHVQGVIAMYNSLTEEEKTEFLKLIMMD